MAESGRALLIRRLEKNQRHLRKWLRNHDITCYRLYDRDLQAYAVAIDVYHQHVHVQEYEAPPSADGGQADERLGEVLEVVAEVLGTPHDQIAVKLRRRQQGRSQYERFGRRGERFEVREAGHCFLVNLTDYLDTGLFLDHRSTRAFLAERAAGRRFLNLFCYTATATVYAAAGGASETTSVDLSQNYLDWAGQNLVRNGLAGPAHRLVQADCRNWLTRERAVYDLIFVDPPTFSNSKRMQGTFDVQRDHVALLRAAVRCLAPEGLLVFSNNYRRFRMDAAALPELAIRDMTRATIPKDFERSPGIHTCYRITHAAPSGPSTGNRPDRR